MRHPAEFYIKYLIIRDKGMSSVLESEGMQIIQPSDPYSTKPSGGITDAHIIKQLDDWGFLHPDLLTLGFLRSSIGKEPEGFDPFNKFHRESVKYLREQKVYDLFFPTSAVEEAWDILADQRMRQICEQIVLARGIDSKILQTVNKKYNYYLTEAGLRAFEHFFWNVNLLTFDQWGKYLYERSALYSDYMALLRSPPQVLLSKLRISQHIESKEMIRRAQDIAFNTLEQVNVLPGTGADKVKAIGVLTKSIVDCDTALSASDVALSGVLKKFENFRVDHPQIPAPDVKLLAPAGNFSGSGAEARKKDKTPSS